MSKWLIVAHAPHFCSKEVKNFGEGRRIVALDGAANEFKRSQLRPHVILGDFDSIQEIEYWGVKATFAEIGERDAPYQGCFGIEIVPSKDQNKTDLEKAIIYCDLQGAESIYIINATGGRIDHTLKNIGDLRKYHHPERPLRIYGQQESIEYLREKSVTLQGSVGSNCSLMGYPEAKITTQGLLYDVTDYPLKLGLQESSSNAFVASEAYLKVEGEALIILSIVDQSKI